MIGVYIVSSKEREKMDNNKVTEEMWKEIRRQADLLNIPHNNINNSNYSASALDTKSTPFGIYTEGGFNFSNNTKAK